MPLHLNTYHCRHLATVCAAHTQFLIQLWDLVNTKCYSPLVIFAGGKEATNYLNNGLVLPDGDRKNNSNRREKAQA